MGTPKYKINKKFFTNKNEEYWYFLGLISSDGYISDEKVELCLNEKDGFNGVEDSELFSFSYHNFPDEIYNSKGELISKRDKWKREKS